MPLKEPTQPKPIVTKNSSEFKLDLYAPLPPEELVVFAVQVLQADASPATPEDIVSTCFRFFPHSFALKNYFYWPDSAQVTRRLNEAKEQGLLKGNAADGFEVKVQGRQAAKRTAKALGVTLPVPLKLEDIAPLPTPDVKKVEPKAPVIVKETVEVPVEKPKKLNKQKKIARKRRAKSVAKALKQKKAEAKRKKPVARKRVVKQVVSKPAPRVKPKPKKKPKARVSAPILKRKTAPKPEKKRVKPVRPVVKAKKQIKSAVKPKIKKPKAQKAKTAKAAQLALPFKPLPAKKKARVAPVKPKVREEAPTAGDKKPAKSQTAPVPISKEEREKAAKVIKQVERSDAFRHYKKNGRKARISEFEFRDMLFTTMESSPETLKRNVDTFRRYARIRERADVVTFLDFCEEHFAALLKTKAKFKGKR